MSDDDKIAFDVYWINASLDDVDEKTVAERAFGAGFIYLRDKILAAIVSTPDDEDPTDAVARAMGLGSDAGAEPAPAEPTARPHDIDHPCGDFPFCRVCAPPKAKL